MSRLETLGQKLTEYAEAEFNYVETRSLNDVSKIDLGCTGIYMETTVIYFEIKNLPYILKENGRRKIAQAYTMVKEVIDAVIEQDNAFVNCFAPNAFLIVYPGRDESLEPAVRAAMKIAHALSDDFHQQFSGITGFEYSMGLDHGHLMGSKNLSDNGVEHLTWFGTTIYKAARIAKESTRPYHVGLSGTIYHSLGDELRITQRHIFGLKKTVEMWTKVTYQYDNVKKHLYQTNYKLPLDKA